MNYFARLSTIVLILGIALGASVLVATPPVAEAAEPPAEPLGPESPLACSAVTTATSGALHQVCRASLNRNDKLVVYAHGYVAADQPLAIPPEAAQIGAFANIYGFDFATTSYPVNGLAVQPAIEDLLVLINEYTTTHGAPVHIYLMGFSEGGLITALSIERHPEIYNGGLAACGPYGDFREQGDYLTDFRVAFDYFFPSLLPPTPITIPVEAQTNWLTYAMSISQAIQSPANALTVTQLFSVTHAATDPLNAQSRVSSTVDILWYNVFGMNDAKAKLGGQPYENATVIYGGSLDDAALNAGVQRFSADPAARAALNAYQTTGVLTRPLVTLHTTRDPIVPIWHQWQYRLKTYFADNIALHQAITYDRYGHCNFTVQEIMGALDVMQEMVDTPPPYQPGYLLFLPLMRR